MTMQMTDAAAARTDSRPRPGDAGGRIAAAIARAFRRMAENSAGMRACREVERLEALSDAELARLGLRRDRIVSHVFGRLHAW
jgi:hypothetical protein